MHGQIGIESEPEKGTTFRFTARFEVPTEADQARMQSGRENMQNLKVLIVDDNETNRVILQEMTHSWGMSPQVAPGVDEAIQLLDEARQQGAPFEIILTDMYMPKRNGFDLIEWVRNSPHYADVTVMILSSGPTPEHRSRAEELRVASYLTKPIKQSTLLDAIATAFGPADAPQEDFAPMPAADRSSIGTLRMLLADDNPVNQMTATTMLEKLGHEVVVANNGLEVIQQLEQHEFDIVFMDVQMPEMDGMTATAIIRENEESSGAHVPIVAMTAHAMKGDKEKCLAAGMDDYVSKPVRRKALAEVVDRIAERFLNGGGTGDEGQAGAENEEGPKMILDVESLLEECDNDMDLLSRMVEIFERDAQERLPRLQAAVQAGDAETVKQEAHALKGGMGTFFAQAAFDTAYQLENSAAEGDLSQAQSLMNTLINQLDELRARLAELLGR
jgi:CheY-like chemotaxis protein